MTQREINEIEWLDKSNWKWSLFYCCATDTRVWVPKKPKWCGWTLNFAKKQSYLWLFVLLIVPIAIIILASPK
jgi:uncharacterized membrane protein